MIPYNISIDAPSFAETCRLDQVAMLNQLEKMPSKIIILMALALAALFFYIYIVPLLKKDWQPILCNSLVVFAIGLLVFAVIMQAAITFNISQSTWDWTEGILFGLFGIWAAIMIFKKRKKIKVILSEAGKEI